MLANGADMTDLSNDVLEMAEPIIDQYVEKEVVLSGPKDFPATESDNLPQIHINSDLSITVLPVDPQTLSGGSTDAEPVNDVIGDLVIEKSAPRTLEQPEPATIVEVAENVKEVVQTEADLAEPVDSETSKESEVELNYEE